MTDITTYAAAYLLLTGQVADHSPPPVATPIICQLPAAPVQGNHIVVRWVGNQHPQPIAHEKGRGRHRHHPPPHHHR